MLNLSKEEIVISGGATFALLAIALVVVGVVHHNKQKQNAIGASSGFGSSDDNPTL